MNTTINTDEGEVIFEVKQFDISQTYKLQLEYFIDCLNNNKKPMNSLEDSIPALRICLQDEK
jgi:hypothetical protein